MKIRAWFQKAAAKIAALEYFFFELFGWLAFINPLCLPAMMIAWNPWISLATIIAVSVFFKLTAKIKGIGNIILDLVCVFLNIQREVSVKENTLRAAETGLWFAIYYAADWLIFWFYVSVALLLKKIAVDTAMIFLVLWAVEFSLAVVILLIWKKAGRDITLGKAYRNSFDLLYQSSRIMAIPVLIALIIKFVLWDGSDRIIVFADKEANSLVKRGFLLALVSCIKMAVWTKIILMGYGTISELLANL